MIKVKNEIVEDKSLFYWKFSSEQILGGGNSFPNEADIRKAKREYALKTDEERSNSPYWTKIYGQKLVTTYVKSN